MYDSYEEAVAAAKLVDGGLHTAVITKRSCFTGFSFGWHYEKEAYPVGHIFYYKYDPPTVVVGNVFQGKEVTL